MSHSIDRPASTVASMAYSLGTGNAPGMPRHTGHTRVFGSPPNSTGHPQNIFVFDEVISVCISRPITASYSSKTSIRRSFAMGVGTPLR